MKKLIAMTLALILCFSLVVPVSASDDLYMIFDGETDKGCETPTGWGRIGGPVSGKYGWPEAVQGEYSFLVMSSTDKVALYYTLPETLDATKYEYIEFDIYFASNLFADFEIGLCSDVADTVGATWKMKEAWFCPDKWTHIKIPVSAFGDFTETYGGNLNSINQVVFKFTKVFDTYELWETGKLVTPTSFDFQLDNVIATNGDAGKDNELIDYDTMMLDPYIEWDIIPSPPIPLAPTLYGDANGDCTIAIEDALLILQSSVGKITLADKTRVDVNANGTVESTDALCVLQYSIGKITSFPMAMIYNAETEKNSEVYIEEPGTHLGIVSKDASLGHPAPTEGDYSYCINTSGNQVALYYTLPKSFDATEYEYIEMDVYSEFEIVSNWSFGLATDPADAEGASWNMTAAWIPGKRWTHIKMPISAFSDFTETYGGDMGDINRIKILITNIMDGVQLVDDGYPTTPKYTYIYFDNITATKNGAGKDNDLIDVETVMIDPPVWFENYRGIICGGI